MVILQYVLEKPIKKSLELKCVDMFELRQSIPKMEEAKWIINSIF